MGLSGGKFTGTILGNIYGITWYLLMATARCLRYAPVVAHTVYHAISDRVIRRVAVTAVTDASRARLKWSRVHVVDVGWMFVGVGCNATSKGAELSCDLDYAISF